jgi:hypothetical protein
VELAF